MDWNKYINKPIIIIKANMWANIGEKGILMFYQEGSPMPYSILFEGKRHTLWIEEGVIAPAQNTD